MDLCAKFRYKYHNGLSDDAAEGSGCAVTKTTQVSAGRWRSDFRGLAPLVKRRLRRGSTVKLERHLDSRGAGKSVDWVLDREPKVGHMEGQ